MSGVQITGKIVPLNGGSFPTFEDINGEGGWRVVTSLADRDDIFELCRKEGMEVYVVEEVDAVGSVFPGTKITHAEDL